MDFEDSGRGEYVTYLRRISASQVDIAYSLDNFLVSVSVSEKNHPPLGQRCPLQAFWCSYEVRDGCRWRDEAKLELTVR
jgi:hypothetical protein